MRRLGMICAFVSGCIGVGSNGVSIDYTLSPQEFNENFGSAQPGTVPTVPCTSDTVCSQLPALAGAIASCDTSAGKCILTMTVRTSQNVNLTAQSGFPAQVANSSVVNDVEVNAVNYWVAANSLTFATPPITIYAAPAAVMTETGAGAMELGTIPTVAKAQVIAQSSPGSVDLTDSGKSALGVFAKSFKTPFNVIAVATVVVHGGDPVPSGHIDLFVQPTLAFVIPL